MPVNKNDIDISELIQELKKGFIIELPERLENMESHILSMENGQNFIENYENLYRQAHSLKGLAGTYGLDIITSICHALEDALHEVGHNSDKFNQYGGSYWLKYIDLVREVLTEIESDSGDLSGFDQKLSELQTIQPGGDTCQLHCFVVTSSNLYESLFPSYFENKNVKFSYSRDGYKALGRLLTESFDLLVSDFEIPFLNGLALFGALKMSDCKNKNIKTMLLTSKENTKYTRNTDPDYVVYKDENFTKNLRETILEVIKVAESNK